MTDGQLNTVQNGNKGIAGSIVTEQKLGVEMKLKHCRSKLECFNIRKVFRILRKTFVLRRLAMTKDDNFFISQRLLQSGRSFTFKRRIGVFVGGVSTLQKKTEVSQPCQCLPLSVSEWYSLPIRLTRTLSALLPYPGRSVCVCNPWKYSANIYRTLGFFLPRMRWMFGRQLVPPHSKKKVALTGTLSSRLLCAFFIDINTTCQ